MRGFADPAGNCRRVELRNQRDVRLGDARFFCGNVGQAISQELLVVECKVGDACDKRTVDHIGRVEPTAQPNLEKARIGRRPGERQDRRGRRDLEETGLDVFACVEDFGEQPSEFFIINQSAGDANTLVEADEVRAGEGVNGIAAGFERCTQEGDGRAFAVGSRNVEHRRQLVLGTPKPLEDGADPLQAEAIAGRRKLRQAIKLRLDARMRRACEVGH